MELIEQGAAHIIQESIEMRERYHTELESAKQMGYENVEDRYSCDETFCDRVHEDGGGLADCIYDDMMAFANLPEPMPNMPISCPSSFTCLSLQVATDSQLSSGRHGPKCGALCSGSMCPLRRNTFESICPKGQGTSAAAHLDRSLHCPGYRNPALS